MSMMKNKTKHFIVDFIAGIIVLVIANVVEAEQKCVLYCVKHFTTTW